MLAVSPSQDQATSDPLSEGELSRCSSESLSDGVGAELSDVAPLLSGAEEPLPHVPTLLEYVRIFGAALAFWISAKLVLLLVLVMLLAAYIVCGTCWLVFAFVAPSRLPPRIGPLELEACQHAFVRAVFPARTRSIWTHAESCDIHSLVVKCSGVSRGTLLVLHGTGSSAALLCASCIGPLSEHFDVHAVDLPGYGTSTAEGFDTASVDRTLEIVSSALEEYCAAHGLGKELIVVGHSIGGFYAVHWARRSLRIGRVVLVNPGGMMPMLGAAGAYWAVLFKLGLPTRPLQALGAHVAVLLWPLMRNASPRQSYWACLQTSCAQQHIVERFLDVRFCRVRWRLPAVALAAELAARGQLSLVWSRQDNIMPVEQGRFLAAMLGLSAGDGRSCCGESSGGRFVEMDGPHGPFHEQEGHAITAALLAAIPLPPAPCGSPAREPPQQQASAQKALQLSAGSVAHAPAGSPSTAPAPAADEGEISRGRAGEEELARARARRAARLAVTLPDCAVMTETWSYFHCGLTRASLARAFAQFAAHTEMAGDGGKRDGADCAQLRSLGVHAAWHGR